MNVEELFKKISIRGRFAFGIMCIEEYLLENSIKDFWIEKLLIHLWEFTESDNLDVWDEKISDLNPYNILEVDYEEYPNDFPTINASEYKELKKIYENLDSDLVILISQTIEIGVSNLYGGTGEYSNHSLIPTLEVYKIAEKTISKKPDVNNFIQFKYSESNGWGNKFTKQKII
ncbi:hypothetical protein [Flavobacterium columnare]|uniref:hypothetical protein n=1 Tax=Flavobacterium columnare TaxID=996 RepID=UPI000D1B4E0A|nr:hypothetical protein [Flavobacterium columnare]PTD16294.1 hypothetical protein C6N29_01355 [Flavobacterium columnare]